METKHVTKPEQIAYPACCDIYEDNGNINVRIEMPGVNKSDLDIKINGDVLIIHAHKKLATYKNGKYLVKEIRDGDYHHEFTIDNTIDRNKIDAELNQGILILTLHIKESEKPRKIDVIAK